jgi:hypothetical protein
MDITTAKSLAQHPGAFSHGDRYLIVNTATGVPLESHLKRDVADYFCDAVNRHEIRCGRNAIYTVQEVT